MLFGQEREIRGVLKDIAYEHEKVVLGCRLHRSRSCLFNLWLTRVLSANGK